MHKNKTNLHLLSFQNMFKEVNSVSFLNSSLFQGGWSRNWLNNMTLRNTMFTTMWSPTLMRLKKRKKL